jgi:hypothetical protein
VKFSTLWKKVFHSMENFPENFPTHGKNRADFSILWKKVFHTMEKTAGGRRARVVAAGAAVVG